MNTYLIKNQNKITFNFYYCLEFKKNVCNAWKKDWFI